MVGIRTSMAMGCDSSVASCWQLVHDDDLFLGHLAVDDPVGPELHGSVVIPPVLIEAVPRAHEHIVGVGLAREADIGAAGIGLGGGVRVVDDHRLLVALVHLLVELEQVRGVELVERRRPGRVDHLDQPLRAVTALGAGHDAARLVGVVTLGVGDDAVVRRAVDGQHRSRVGPAVCSAGNRPAPGPARSRVVASVVPPASTTAATSRPAPSPAPSATTPTTARPITPPTCWVVVTNPDAAPLCSLGASAIASDVTCGIARPNPAPMTTNAGATSTQKLPSAGVRARSSRPPTKRTSPATSTRAAPYLAARRPLSTRDDAAMARVTGRYERPVAIGSRPRTSWR